MLKLSRMLLRQRSMPAIVARACRCHSAWVLGSQARFDREPRVDSDWDILLSELEWSRLLPMTQNLTCRQTRFGSPRLIEDDIQIDVLIGSIEDYLKQPFVWAAWHPVSGVYWTKTAIMPDMSMELE